MKKVAFINRVWHCIGPASSCWLSAECFSSGSGFGEREVGFDQVSRPQGEHAP